MEIEIQGVSITLTEEQLKSIKLELNKSKFWEATDGKEAYWIEPDGDVLSSSLWNHANDTFRINQGSVFQTEELAEQERDLRFAKQRLKKAIFELDPYSGWKGGVKQFCIVLFNGGLMNDYAIDTKAQPFWMYLSSRELAKQALAENEADYKLVLGE
jgi:MoaA/NifB/PqqE/SkfB family radical SAM enzyme